MKYGSVLTGTVALEVAVSSDAMASSVVQIDSDGSVQSLIVLVERESPKLAFKCVGWLFDSDGGVQSLRMQERPLSCGSVLTSAVSPEVTVSLGGFETIVGIQC